VRGDLRILSHPISPVGQGGRIIPRKGIFKDSERGRGWGDEIPSRILPYVLWEAYTPLPSPELRRIPMGWERAFVRTDFDFGLPVRCFTVSVRQMAAVKIRDTIESNADKEAYNVEQIEKGILEIIRFYRPELVGGAIAAIELRSMQWKIYYWHPDFPRHSTLTGLMIPEEFLIPEGIGDGPMPPISLERLHKNPPDGISAVIIES
jgi:hypothetical protein